MFSNCSATCSAVLLLILINLVYLHEPSILHYLTIRYNQNLIYTFTGDILIAINPFKKIDLYNKTIIDN